MNLEEFQKHQEDFFNNLLVVCRKKQAEYAADGNAFHNFENSAGFSMMNERESAAWEFCVKHLQSVRDIIKSVEVGGEVHGYPTQELIDEKFGDIIVYMTLMHGMLTDRINTYEESKKE